MEQMKNDLQALIATYGETAVAQTIKDLLGKAAMKTPVHEFSFLLTPSALERTVDQLETGISDSLRCGQARDEAYGLKPDLAKRKKELDAEIKLAEAEAFMTCKSDGKNQIVTVNGQEVTLTNDTMRDHYRRNLTAELRRQRAQVEGQLDGIDAQVARATAVCATVENANESIRKKAELQAAMLNYLA
jgi:hypothetical protein